jgi:hypothetical protein
LVQAAVAGADGGRVEGGLDDGGWWCFGVGGQPGGELSPLFGVVGAEDAAEVGVVGSVAVVLVGEEILSKSGDAGCGCCEEGGEVGGHVEGRWRCLLAAEWPLAGEARCWEMCCRGSVNCLEIFVVDRRSTGTCYGDLIVECLVLLEMDVACYRREVETPLGRPHIWPAEEKRESGISLQIRIENRYTNRNININIKYNHRPSIVFLNRFLCFLGIELTCKNEL